LHMSFLWLTSGANITVKNCIFQNSSGISPVLLGLPYGQGGDGSYPYLSTTDVIVANCRFENCAYSAGMPIGDNVELCLCAYGVVISNCEFTNLLPPSMLPDGGDAGALTRTTRPGRSLRRSSCTAKIWSSREQI
jgi:hypothetical protein